MKFSYEDLISGDVIGVENIGHFRSPMLKELKPTSGIGMWSYNLYLNILAWDKEELIKFLRTSSGKPLQSLNNEKLNVFDVVTVIDFSRELLQSAMAFFLQETLTWDAKERVFITQSRDTQQVVGYISRDNFDEVRDMMLQMNYIGIGESAKPAKFTSNKAKELWEQAQAYLKTESKKKAQDKNMALGNIISKLCAANTSYNLLNVYELTIFQLYDQFFQYGYLRAMDLNDMAFSNHGGENFDMQAWLKPIIKF